MRNIGRQPKLVINGKELDLFDPASVAWLEASPEQHLCDLGHFLSDWFSSNDSLLQLTSGSTGSPKQLVVQKQHMKNSAALTIDFFGLRSGMTALLCMSPTFIGGRMMVVRALMAGMDLIVVKPGDNPVAQLERSIDFAAMVPFQFARAVKENPEKLNQIRQLILGGAPVSTSLEKAAMPLRTEIWHTYGMSETLSHIALRKINGAGRSAVFRPFPGINLRLDSRGCLIIDAPMLAEAPMITNDLAILYDDGSFEILGRADHVIISAGIKIHPEQLEARLASFIDVPFVVCPIPDSEAGQRVVLVLEGNLSPRNIFDLWRKIVKSLDKPQIPRQIFTLDQLPLTRSGKADRRAIERMLLAK